MTNVKVFPLMLSVGVCFLAAAMGSVFTTSAIDTWYKALQKPFFNPPNWVFGPVWTLLYLAMGISLYLVWNTKTNKKIKLLGIFIFLSQLVLNALWSLLFFGLKLPTVAFVEIVVLWFAIYFTIRNFFQISKPAGWLLIPYIVWVSFATILNFSIVLLNP